MNFINLKNEIINLKNLNLTCPTKRLLYTWKFEAASLGLTA
jgi:hypothetical protein